MLSPSPYLSPQLASEPPARERRSDLRWVRTIFYLHLAAIVLCAIFILDSTHVLLSLSLLPSSVQLLLAVVGVPAFFSYLYAPIAMAIAASRLEKRPIAFRAAAVLGDVLLSIFQCWVLLPTVQ